MPISKLDKTPKQKEAIKMLSKNIYNLLYGGSRSGKTFIYVYAFVIRALMYPKSQHIICRFRFAHAKQALCYQTIPAVFEALGINPKLNKQDYYYEFDNGSMLWIAGLDDKERTEKILGNEYDSIGINEGSQVSFSAYETLITRLNNKHCKRPLFVMDYNPPSKNHWGYRMFHKREKEDGSKLPDFDYAKLLMNPADNTHLSETYITSVLENLSEKKKRRFLKGEYSDDEGTLWQRDWIRYDKGEKILTRVVVGVDPAGSAGGDEVGIVVAGTYTVGGETRYIVLDDFSLHGTPAQWSAAVKAVHDRWSADLIVAEKNYGGDMVESTIKMTDESLNVKLITSSRGKILRAEPISAMYEKGLVVHREVFSELEDEYCQYDQDSKESPGRMDASVFALTELSGGGLVWMPWAVI